MSAAWIMSASADICIFFSPSGSEPGPSAPVQFDLAAPVTPPPRPRVDPWDTVNVNDGTSPRDKEVWSVGQGR